MWAMLERRHTATASKRGHMIASIQAQANVATGEGSMNSVVFCGKHGAGSVVFLLALGNIITLETEVTEILSVKARNPS